MNKNMVCVCVETSSSSGHKEEEGAGVNGEEKNKEGGVAVRKCAIVQHAFSVDLIYIRLGLLLLL